MLRFIFKWLLLGIAFLSMAQNLAAKATECLGPKQNPKGHLIYLHGLEPLNTPSGEESENRRVLERLARDQSLRIAMPRGAACPSKKLCWKSRNAREVSQTFQAILRSAEDCWSKSQAYAILGFSNGGYFALKLYKLHSDPLLKAILASGSSGQWDPKKDQLNSLSQFHLMIGTKDISLRDAQRFARRFQESKPGFGLSLFPGAHHLDYATLVTIVGSLWH